MSTTDSTFEKIVKWAIVIILGIAALKIVASVLGIAFFLGGFLLFRILPLVLVAYLAYMVIQWLRGKDGGSQTTLDV
jgi:uncharacterized membrane protein YfcA